MVNNSKKYLKSYWHFVKNSIAIESEYRGSFLFKTLAGICWMIGSLFFIQVIFSQTNSVAGWSKLEITLLYITFSISMDLFDLVLRNNFIRFSDHISQGTLDWVLLRPINSRFFVSLMSDVLVVTIIFRLLAGFGLLIYFLPKNTSLENIFGFFLFLLLGNFAVYSIVFCINTLNIWFVKMNNITTFIQNTYGFARVPLDSWPKLMQLFLVYILPMGILSTYAVKALLGKTTMFDVVIAFGTSVALFIISQLFWKFALRHYSSASS